MRYLISTMSIRVILELENIVAQRLSLDIKSNFFFIDIALLSDGFFTNAIDAGYHFRRHLEFQKHLETEVLLFEANKAFPNSNHEITASDIQIIFNVLPFLITQLQMGSSICFI